MNVGELNNVKGCVFVWNNGQDETGNTLTVTPKRLDFFDFRKAFGLESKQCDGLEFDGTGKLWFAVYVEDCHDPLICIVRADNATEAEEIFVNAKEWADVSEEDAKDFPEEHLQPTERGTLYDPESVCIREVFLSSVRF